jgi:hypothetical protein
LTLGNFRRNEFGALGVRGDGIDAKIIISDLFPESLSVAGSARAGSRIDEQKAPKPPLPPRLFATVATAALQVAFIFRKCFRVRSIASWRLLQAQRFEHPITVTVRQAPLMRD